MHVIYIAYCYLEANDPKVFTTLMPYADQTNAMRLAQMSRYGLLPVEYFPLRELQAEIAEIISKLNNNEPMDENRFNYLLACLELHPEHIAMKQEEESQWREAMAVYAKECLEIMRGFIPADIATCTKLDLQRRYGFSLKLSNRIMSNKCLWLIRLSEDELQRIHPADLNGKYCVSTLDVVETAAILAVLPEKFLNDGIGNEKAIWRSRLIESLKKMHGELLAGRLSANLMRHPAYRGQNPNIQISVEQA